MIKPICDKCKREMQDFGGLLFSPPKTLISGSQNVTKQHVCVDCFSSLSECMKQHQCTDTDSLLIRQCKKNKPSFLKFQKIIARYAWIMPERVSKSILFYKLVDLVYKFGMMNNQLDFVYILDAMNQSGECCTKGLDSSVLVDKQLDALVRLIAKSPVAQFPGFKSSGYFRNKYPEEKN